MSSQQKINVAIIGAGPGGLACARHLSLHPEEFKYEVFERYDCVGGQWNHKSNIGLDDDGYPVHSSIYTNMIAVTTKHLMAFPGYKFPPEVELFPHRAKVFDYLQGYAKEFGLLENIHFCHIVTSVSRVPSASETRPQWRVERRNIITEKSQESIFDAVLVCTGHFTDPFVPDIPGLDTFKGILMHSHDYRIPEVYEGKKVVIVGSQFSGFDISRELYPYAGEITIAVKTDVLNLIGQYKSGKYPIKTVKWVDSVDGNTIKFIDGEQKEADMLMLCTGYKTTFPFLDPSCEVTVEYDRHVKPLYHHMIHTKYHTLMFINLPYNPLDFLLGHLQAPIAIKVLNGTLELPSTEEMHRHAAEDYQKRVEAGFEPYQAHSFVHQPWSPKDMVNDLVKLGNVDEDVKKFFECRILYFWKMIEKWIELGFFNYFEHDFSNLEGIITD